MSSKILFIIALLVPAYFWGQELNIEEDVRLWTEVSVEKELVGDLNAGIEIQYRRKNDLSEFDRVLFQPSVEYKISKRFDAEVGYRYSIYLDEKASRWFVAVNYDKGIFKRLDFKYRLKYQEDFSREELAYKRLRNKIELEYNIKGIKWTPEVGVELFSGLGDDGFYFNRTRLAMSVKRKVSKSQDLSLSCYRQWDYYDEIPSNTTIFILSYSFEL